MTWDPGDLPYLNVRSPSATPEQKSAKIDRPRRAQRRRQAPPLSGSRIYGPGTPVRLTLTPRFSSEAWIEVEYEHGRFWVKHDAGVWDLIRRMQEGGFWVSPRAERGEARGGQRRRKRS